MPSSLHSRPQGILLPVKPALIAFTLASALLLNLLPLTGFARWLRPDFVALAVLYWTLQQPHRFGMGLAFALGLVMDVAVGTLFGQHALAYSLLAFAGFMLHRRLRMFGLLEQLWQVLPLLLATQLVLVVVSLAKGAVFPGWQYFLGGVVGGLLWPLLSVLLRLPRLPKSDPDRV
ncbi:MAG TPA: rod shape-determining protein MreD [Burkholderiales bacterium]|nr:rod shape-determining protein MreD [Burkholderiales bacterium]